MFITIITLLISLSFSSALLAEKGEDLILKDLTKRESQLFEEIYDVVSNTNLDLKTYIVYDIRQTFKQHFNQWKNDFFEQDINLLFSEIISSQSISSKKIKILKNNRKYAHLVRQNYLIFDINQEPPKFFAQFVRDFGRLNDHLAINNFNEAANIAKKLFNSMDTHQIDLLNDSYTPQPNEMIIDQIKSTHKKIKKILASQEIDIHTFHSLRKLLKSYLYFYSVSNDSTASITFKKLDKIISKIGDLNDFYTELIISGKLDDKNYKLTLSEDLKEKIKDLSKTIKKEICNFALI